MKPAKFFIGAALLLASALSGSAWARVWVHVGIPFPFYHPPPVVVAVPAYPPVVAPAAPPVYVEQGTASPVAGPPGNYWYYCTDPPGYYPYISACPPGWLTVVPQAPPGR